MASVFVSCENIDAPWATALVEQLRALGFRVDHSPRNPAHGTDQRWDTWYRSGLSAALDSAEYFIVALTRGWESSTWMGEESHLAAQRLTEGRLRGMYYFDPEHAIERGVPRMQQYLRVELPGTAEGAATYLARLHEPSI